jgi:hypothetical protein
MALESTPPLTEISTRKLPGGVKGGRRVRLTTLSPFTLNENYIPKLYGYKPLLNNLYSSKKPNIVITDIKITTIFKTN